MNQTWYDEVIKSIINFSLLFRNFTDCLTEIYKMLHFDSLFELFLFIIRWIICDHSDVWQWCWYYCWWLFTGTCYQLMIATVELIRVLLVHFDVQAGSSINSWLKCKSGLDSVYRMGCGGGGKAHLFPAWQNVSYICCCRDYRLSVRQTNNLKMSMEPNSNFSSHSNHPDLQLLWTINYIMIYQGSH